MVIVSKTMRTPQSRIKGELRRLFLKSVERNEAIKRDKYACCVCHRKQSTKKEQELKVQVHHLEPINWNSLIESITNTLLCDSSMLQTLCVDCHHDITYNN